MTGIPLRIGLCSLALAAWALLLAGDYTPAVPAWCGAGGAMALALVPAALGAMLRVMPLTDLLIGSALMLPAMMMPLVLRPVELVRAQGGSAALFLAGYGVLWLPVIGLLGLWSTALQLATFGSPWLGIAIAGGIVVLWHATPLRARCLAACRRPPGTASFRAGMRQGLACIGASSAAMSMPLLFGQAHLAAMAVVTALLWHERRAGAEAV